MLGATTMGLHHKLCHVLGGSFDLPHAETHTVVLPHALAYNACHAPPRDDAHRPARWRRVGRPLRGRCLELITISRAPWAPTALDATSA